MKNGSYDTQCSEAGSVICHHIEAGDIIGECLPTCLILFINDISPSLCPSYVFEVLIWRVLYQPPTPLWLQLEPLGHIILQENKL